MQEAGDDSPYEFGCFGNLHNNDPITRKLYIRALRWDSAWVITKKTTVRHGYEKRGRNTRPIALGRSQ